MTTARVARVARMGWWVGAIVVMAVLPACSSSASGGSGGPGPVTCDGATSTDACGACVYGACCSQLEACVGDSDCSALLTCTDGCSGSSTCESSCMQSYPAGATLFDDVATCESQSCTSACSAPSASSQPAATGCSTDGSDAVVAGTYAYSFGSQSAYDPEYTFSFTAFVPNCQFCSDLEDSYVTSDDVSPIGQWSSAWSPDRSSIIVSIGTKPTWAVSPDGNTLVDDSISDQLMARQTPSSPMMRTCDGHQVVSETNW
jgi:hypothetical protein